MFGAVLGSMTCFAIADEIGRKLSLILASVLFFFGGIIEYVSGDSLFSYEVGISSLVVGRLVYGYACGFAMHGAPAYIGEMAPTQIRGFLISMKEVFIVLGMVLGYSIGYHYSEHEGGWRYVYLWSCLFSVLMCGGMIYLPYSARWLALKGRLSESTKSLLFVSATVSAADMEAVVASAQAATLQQQQSSSSSGTGDSVLCSSYSRLKAPAVWPAVVAGVGLVFFQQVTGQPSVLYYTNTIFVDIGLSTVASVGVSSFQLLMTGIATVTVDKHGRKRLLYLGTSCMLIALVMLSILFLYPYKSTKECQQWLSKELCVNGCEWNNNCASSPSCLSSTSALNDCHCCYTTGLNTQKILILISLFIYIGGYQIGYGPVSWLLISEIFPLQVRSQAVALAVITNFLFNFFVTFLFPISLHFFGSSYTFFVFTLVLVCGIYFIYKYVPETKGLTLEQIEKYFIDNAR